MTAEVSVFYEGQSHKYVLEKNAPISVFLKERGLIAQACGSAGTCGKCRIIANTEPTIEEQKILTSSLLVKGVRLACYTKAKEGLEIQILEQATLTVLTTYSQQEYEFTPLVERLEILPSKPDIEDQRDDLTRVLDTSNCTKHSLKFKDLAELSKKVHSDSAFEIYRYQDELLGIAKSKHHLAMAVDIGTTTIAATLIDLVNNKVLGVIGEANAQAPWGADVISRINQTIEESNSKFDKNIKQLQEVVVKQIDTLRKKLLLTAQLPSIANVQSDNDTDRDSFADVQYITIAGNTTMMHFLAGIPAKNISRAPFIPVTLEASKVNASELGMDSNALMFLMPSIAGYIGADIVAAMLAVNAHSQDKPFLLLDLGTNAEIVLGYQGKFLTCSAAAGPCFEGASLSCGLAGQEGAINKVTYLENGFEFCTINDKPAKGICGSGVLDSIAMLLESGSVDETGYLDGENSTLASHIKEDDKGQNYFEFTENIVLTQKDIREVQLAKAAVRAGIHTLLAEAGLEVDDVANLYIAGGFGSAMDPKSAARIGLIPTELLDRTHAIGNGASLGVIRYATEKNVHEHVSKIVNNTKYLELSALPVFTSLYVEQMIF